MSAGAQTQGIPRVRAAVAADVLSVVAARPVEITDEESVQHLYEAGLARLHALHDRWSAQIAHFTVPNAPEEAAA